MGTQNYHHEEENFSKTEKIVPQGIGKGKGPLRRSLERVSAKPKR